MTCEDCGVEFEPGDLDQVAYHCFGHVERPDMQYSGSRMVHAPDSDDEEPDGPSTRWRDAVLDLLVHENDRRILSVRAELGRYGAITIEKVRSMPGLEMTDFLYSHDHDGMPGTYHAMRVSEYLRQSYALRDIVADAACSAFDHTTPGSYHRYVLRVFWAGAGRTLNSLSSEHTSALFVDIRKWDFIDAPVKLNNTYVGISGRTSHPPEPHIVRIDFIPKMS